MTLPSSATVVPAMSRQAMLILLIERLLSDSRRAGHTPAARAGHEHHARGHPRSVVQLLASDLAVHARPAQPGGRQARSEQLLGPAAQVLVGSLVDVEGERLVVAVRV